MNRRSERLELLARLQMGTMPKRTESNRKRERERERERDLASLPTMSQFFNQLIFSDNTFCE